jgi:hypothetical protein
MINTGVFKKYHSGKNEKNSSDKNFFLFFIRKTSPGSEKKIFIIFFMKSLPGDSNTFSKLNNHAKSTKIIFNRNNKPLIYLIFCPE